MFKLPKLTTDIDCEPLGYPGLVVRCWLNPTYEPWEPPAQDAKPWERMYFHGLSRIIEAVTFPAGYTASGVAETIEIPDEKAIYDLMYTPGFEQAIVNWAVEQYNKERQARYQVELKN